MKKFNKYAFMAVAALLSAGMTACSDSESDYIAAEPETNAQVYFSNEASTTIIAKSTENKASVTVCRIKTDDAITVPITVVNDSDLFIPATSVSFAAGQAKAELPISYDFAKVGYDNYSNITVSIAPEYKTAYGMSEFSFKIGIPAPWTSLGKATFNEYWWSGGSYSVELQQNDIDNNLYRLVNPFADGGNYTNGAAYFEFKIYKAGETFNGETLTYDMVYYPMTAMTYYDYYDAVINIVHPSSFKSCPDQTFWTHNNVTYQEDGTPAVVQIAPFFYMDGVGGWNYSQKDGYVQIIFPGYAPKDYAIEATYDGMLTKGSSISVASTITLGEDVASAKVVAVPETALETIEDDLLSGAVESIELTESGSVYIPFEYTDPGSYYVVAIAYDETGEEVNAAVASFKVDPSTGETWTTIATGTYTYAGFFEGVESGLKLMQSDTNPSRYKIAGWNGDVDLHFTMSAYGSIVLLDYQEIGYTLEDYGAVYVDDAEDYYGSSENPLGKSSFDTTTFTFNFAAKYFIPSVGGWTPKYETFVLDQAESAPKRAASKSRHNVKDSVLKTTRQQLYRSLPIDRQIQLR